MWPHSPEESIKYHYNPDLYMDQPIYPMAPVYNLPVYGSLPFPLPLQKTEATPKQKNAPNMSIESNGLPIGVKVGLAVLNGLGRPMTTADVYSFIMTHWPIYRDKKYTSWKGSVRRRLVDDKVFTKLTGESMLKSLYILNPSNAAWAQGKVQQLEKKRISEGLALDVYGLEDESVWDKMISGCLGLPPLQNTDLRFKRKKESSEDLSTPKRAKTEEAPATTGTATSDDSSKEMVVSTVCEETPKIEAAEKYSQEPVLQAQPHFLPSIELFSNYYNYLCQFWQKWFYSHNAYERDQLYEYQPNEVPLEEIEPTFF